MSELPEPAPEPGPEPAGNPKMLAISAQCGIAVTRHPLQDTILERDGPFGVHNFPRYANEDEGDTLSEWLFPDQEPDDPEWVAALRSAVYYEKRHCTHYDNNCARARCTHAHTAATYKSTATLVEPNASSHIASQWPLVHCHRP